MSNVVTYLVDELMGGFKKHPAFLRAEGLHKAYKKGKDNIYAVRGISLGVKKGEILVIVGPSGAGKSTLLHLLGGLDTPTEGKVFLDDHDIYGISDRKRTRLRNKKIGFVFLFYHLLPEFSVLENTILPTLMQKRKEKRSVVMKHAEELLSRVGLADRIHFKPNELSGGEAQRVAIARALINEPEIVLCDEPTGNLDSRTASEIYNLIHLLNKTKHTTFVIATHEQSLAKTATRVVHLKDGKIE